MGKDPKVKKQTSCPGKKECEVKSYIGDARCDDNNNYCSCNWDQGDCCGSSGDSRQFLYCKECKCKAHLNRRKIALAHVEAFNTSLTVAVTTTTTIAAVTTMAVT